ncbi:osmoprotectant transport system permease protein [Weissella uvarum]|uniref:ABC transporter permease/substrate-binding protein n=1 Tax=Weissella uvarum TaxID=1479233 RepID=UPI0019614902|nr:ABC transporter permease/substrate-binding protein [Weissella uvarum]MBM7617010.1 osmoprotectant transport system permease protein [Weissella uvarum]MCM0595308.1 ABC transporter permease/substrate-binding protein [Weissella uvarum]
MTSFINFIQAQGDTLRNALFTHIGLSLVSVALAMLIAIPLAIALMNHPRLGEVMLQITGVIQTIPSLAILGLLIPIVGIGTVPAIIALVLYALMPIFQNTYAGLTQIDANLLEAADAFGLSWWYKLFKIRLPLALPLIFSGIRIALVLVIGTATLASLIGGGGLGTFIMQGIQNNNNTELLVGAVCSAALAIIFSIGLRLLSHLSLKKLALVIGLLIVGLGGAFGFQAYQQQQHQEVVIAGKLGGEPEILMNMYRELIQQENPKLKVTLKPNFGNTTFIFRALQNKQVDIYPEFTGTVLQNLYPEKLKSHNPAQVYQQAHQVIQEKSDLTYLKPMAYENRYALAVDQQTAKRYHLKTVSDLARVSPQLSAAFENDFYHQQDGYQGLKRKYQLHFKNVKSMEPSLRYEALKNHQVQVVDAYTTDPQIKVQKLVVLKDDLAFFPPYQGAPLVRNELIKRHPEIQKSLNRLHNRISESEMIEMNYKVTVKHEKAQRVAHEYLKSYRLIR